jgi:tRNA threonylcarbamoyladenosine biosynthesis protein TsaB
MALILNIDTATATGSICLADGDKIIEVKASPNQREHAGWLHPAIANVLAGNGYHIKDLQAVAITAGPGSYTGLRVAMATAKGLCFARQIPLITINTLKMMAFAARSLQADLYCPLIDARRMEVFMAIYDNALNEVLAPCAALVENGFADQFAVHKKLLLFGDGAEKCRPLTHHAHVQFGTVSFSAGDLAPLAAKAFEEGAFANVEYAEPLYVKPFFTIHKKQ